MSEYVLELRNIVKRFPGVVALNNVQFQLKPGEVHALMGENGAGKSTLIKVITGVHKPERLCGEYVSQNIGDIRAGAGTLPGGRCICRAGRLDTLVFDRRTPPQPQHSRMCCSMGPDG